jgi:hypothetical protein
MPQNYIYAILNKGQNVNSSSAHITVDSHIPMFADYYFTYRAVESQWWYVDEEMKKP